MAKTEKTDAPKRATIVSLEISNVLRLTAAKFCPKPDGSLYIVGGKNGAGKSAALKCIEMAFGGKGTIPPTPVHRGAKKGWIKVDLGSLRVTRTITPSGGGGFKVEDMDGNAMKSPQAILEKMYNSLTFDPFAFSTAPPAKQLAMLKQLAGIDFTDLDARHAKLFAERTVLNTEAKRLKALLASSTEHPDTPSEYVSVADLASNLEKGQATNREHSVLRSEAHDARREHADANKLLGDVELEIARLQEQRDDMAKGVAEREEEATKAEAAISGLQDIDCQPIHDALGTAETTNSNVRDNLSRVQTQADRKEAADKADALSAKLDEIDAEKVRLVEDAKFPVEGLALAEDVVLYNNIPFENAAKSEKWRVSTAVCAAMNPELGVMLVHDGSLLDKDGLKDLGEIAESTGMQAWVERVGEGEECSVIIEDGHVKGVEPVDEPAEPDDPDLTDESGMEREIDPEEDVDQDDDHDGGGLFDGEDD